jgi:hypothetical protein
LNGTLSSVDSVARAEGWDHETHTPARELSIEALRASAHEIKGALSFRGLLLIEASMIRAGLVVGFGEHPYPFQPMPEEQQQAVLAQAELELRLEEARRRLAREAPSRLSCLWLADDDPRGRGFVERIMGRESFLFPVEIVREHRLSRHDAHLLDGPIGSISGAAIEGYWSGQATESEPLWETLLDGVIRCTDDQALARLRAYNAAHIPFKDE